MGKITIFHPNTLAGEQDYGKATSHKVLEAMVEKVESGQIAPLNALAELTCLKTACEDAIAEIRDLARKEANKQEANSFCMYGVRFVKTKGTPKYDFSGDENWKDFDQRFKDAKQEKADYEDYLKQTGKAVLLSQTETISATLL